MKKILKIIFNQFYVWACKNNFANSPHLSAMYFLGLILFFNLLGLISLARLILGYNFLFIKRYDFRVIIVLATITLLIYLLYVKNKKYLIFYDEYCLFTEKKKKSMNFITILYIVFSIILSFGVAICIGLHKKGIL